MKLKRAKEVSNVASVKITAKRLKEMLDSAYICGAQDERAAISRKQNYAKQPGHEAIATWMRDPEGVVGA